MWLILASGALLALLLAACYVLGVGEETLPARPSPAALQEHQKRCGHWFQSPLTMLRATGSLEALRARVNRDKRSKLQQLSVGAKLHGGGAAAAVGDSVTAVTVGRVVEASPLLLLNPRPHLSLRLLGRRLELACGSKVGVILEVHAGALLGLDAG